MTINNGAAQARTAGSNPSALQDFPKRFYKAVSVDVSSDGFAVLLDGRQARTPGRNQLSVPSRALADVLAAEWAAVGETIDPRTMPLTRLVNTVIDGVSQRQREVLAEVSRFAASDLLAYRAAEPAELVQMQCGAWDPVLDWARRTFGVRLTLTEGLMHVAQPPEVLQAFERSLASMVGEDSASPYRIGALHVMTTLTGSALLAAAVASDHLTVQDAWSAAHVDEDFQISKWGEDAEAKARRSSRWQEMEAAHSVYRTATDLTKPTA